ncbi:MAG TPA: hypothetical protein PLK90_01070 [Clostridiales bacterium]|nr:hypothetical protein [Clostridiales bacterium]HQP68968.1 hypothetical protein [Clostridiales bacterium]
MFILWANIMSALNWLIFCGLVLDTKSEGPVGLAVVFTVPVLLGSAYLLMVAAFIRGERPFWAYLIILFSPIIFIAAVSSAVHSSDVNEILAALVITGIGLLLLGFGKIIKMFLPERYNVREVDSEQKITTNFYSRFIIKTTLIISIANGFFILIFVKDEFGEILISLSGVLTIITLILLLIAKIKSENPNFKEVLLSNSSLFASLVASAYFSEWLMFWIIILVILVIEPVIWILFKYKIKIWLSIIILAVTLTGVFYITYSIMEYIEHKRREKLEERWKKSDLEYLQSLKLNGDWVMILPAGYRINVSIQYLGEFKFKIDGKIFSAENEMGYLQCYEDKNNSIDWKIVDKDSLLLKDYHCSGLVMVRGEKLLKMKDVPELKLSGRWAEISPGYFKNNSTIAYLGYLKYKIDGEIFDVDFTEGILTNYQDKKNPVEWKIVDNDSLQLINNKSKEAVLVRGDKIKKNIPKPTDPDLTGKWELVMPTGSKYDAEIEYLGKMMYSIRSLQYLGDSNYEFTGKEFKMHETQDKPWNHYIWKIENGNYLILTETPLEEAYRNDYCGAILKRKGSKSIITPPTEPNLSGRWNLTTPKGYTYNVAVEYLGNSLYRIAWNGEMGGVYEIGKKELKMYNPSGVSTRNYKWEITGKDSLILTSAPAEKSNGKSYLKSLLIRSNKKSSSIIKKAPEIEGQWDLFIPPEYKYKIKIAKIGELRYRISDSKGTAFVGDYEFIEDELVMIPQKGKPSWKTYTWKIENNKKLNLLSSEYQGAVLSR